MFLRLGEELAKRGAADIFFVDYHDGAMAKAMRSDLATLVPYSDEAVTLIPPDAIAVFQSLRPWMIDRGVQLDPATRLLFWNCHPFNLVPTLPGFRRAMQSSVFFGRVVLLTALRLWRNKMIKLVKLMSSHRSLVFMDTTNVLNTERYLGIRLDAPYYLPIPAIQPERSRRGCVFTDPSMDGLHVCWVGRIVDFKYFIFLYTLRELDKIQPKLGIPIMVSVIGSGDYGEKLRLDAANLGRLNIEFVEALSSAQLDTFLFKKCDLLFAMGTSALEGAKLGVPTILLDISYKEVASGYLFRWFYERQGFTLGDMVDEHHFSPGNESLLVRLQELLLDPVSVSAKSAVYFNLHHSVSSVSEQFMRVIDSATCTWQDLTETGLTGRGISYSIFAWCRKCWANLYASRSS